MGSWKLCSVYSRNAKKHELRLVNSARGIETFNTKHIEDLVEVERGDLVLIKTTNDETKLIQLRLVEKQ